MNEFEEELYIYDEEYILETFGMYLQMYRDWRSQYKIGMKVKKYGRKTEWYFSGFDLRIWSLLCEKTNGDFVGVAKAVREIKAKNKIELEKLRIKYEKYGTLYVESERAEQLEIAPPVEEIASSVEETVPPLEEITTGQIPSEMDKEIFEILKSIQMDIDNVKNSIQDERLQEDILKPLGDKVDVLGVSIKDILKDVADLKERFSIVEKVTKQNAYDIAYLNGLKNLNNL